MELGRGDAFRNPAWLERTAAALSGAFVRSTLRAPLTRAYEAVLDRLPGDHLVSRFPGGECVRLAAAYRQMSWNVEEYHAFKADAAPGGVVLDIGANLGAYSLLFAQWIRPSGHVYAFEPAPQSRRGLERHLLLNHCERLVSISPDAVSSCGGDVRFRADSRRGDNRILTGADDGGHGIDVKTTSIDEFCAARQLAPSLIKIDVEGAELEVLKGARETIASRGGGLRIYMEMHPRAWRSFGASRALVEEELARQELKAERIDGGEDVWGLEGVCLRLRRCGS